MYKGQGYIWFDAFIVIVQTGTSTILERERGISSKTIHCMNKLIKMTSYYVPL
jgi:hypothetical protein